MKYLALLFLVIMSFLDMSCMGEKREEKLEGQLEESADRAGEKVDSLKNAVKKEE